MDSSILDNTDVNTEESKKQESEDVNMKNEEPVFKLDDAISQNFKGKIKQIITYTGTDGQEKTKESINDFFAAILIRVIGFKEIYEAWEEQYQSALEGYNANESLYISTQQSQNKHEQSEAFQREWLIQVPKVLCLQLNRIEYKDQELIKNRNKCAIEKTLYIDRFMYENRVKSMQLQKHVKELREQIRHLELSIEKFTNFNKSEYDILKVFEQSIKFFSEQGKIADDW